MEKYNMVNFSNEQLPMFFELLQITKKTYDNEEEKYIKVADVFNIIGKHSTSSDKKGITKKDIQEDLKISRKICDDIISILQGTTMITSEDLAREQPYKLTSRGYQLAKFIKENK